MTAPPFWTSRARADLRELSIHLADYDPAVARRAALAVFAKANRLADVPGVGRPGAEPDTRELSIPRWKRVMVYRLIGGRIEILALRDPRRQTPEP